MKTRSKLDNGRFLLVSALALFLIASAGSAQVKVMPLGNSITRGVRGPSNDDAGYRNDLAQLLTDEGVAFEMVGSLSDGVGFDSDHEGHDGLRADQVRDSVAIYLAANLPDVVLLHIGTNDIKENQSNESTASEIGQIIDAISDVDASIKIIMSSLLPRADEKDEQVTKLNALALQVYLEKRDAGALVFYAGMNEIMKTNPTWKDDFFDATDLVHPNNAGFQVMARVWLNKLTTALGIGDDLTVVDNFGRSSLGITWDADDEYDLVDGNLVNTAKNGNPLFEFMATFKEVINPTRVALRWSDAADAAGIGRGGLALMLDSDSRDASGFLAWITPSDNQLKLWTIVNGAAGSDVAQGNSNAPAPGPGDVMRVEVAIDGAALQFSYFVNDDFAGTLSAANPGNSGKQYAGILTKHNLNNDVAEFFAEGKSDFVPPARVQDLRITAATPVSMSLSWTSSGDDGNDGGAVSYDLRYATSNIANAGDFQAATQAPNMPVPSPSGTQETFTILDLTPETTYFFALRVFDEAGNPSQLSNVATASTASGSLFADDFDRATLGGDWDVVPSIQIVGDELENTSADAGTWDLAVMTARGNPVEVSFKWSASVNSLGIDQSGIAVWLDAPSKSANGYLVTRRTQKNEIRLWRITAGQGPSDPIVETPLLGSPRKGDEFRIRLSSDASGNHFTVFINGEQDITITDPDFFIDPRSRSEFYSGVMLAGGQNNNIDDFTALISDTPVSVDGSIAELPQAFVLSQNYPNPFNPETRIDYTVSAPGEVRIAVFNLMGQRVRTLFSGQQASGRHTIVWDGRAENGSSAASGFYLLRMLAGESWQVRKMQLVR